jgi:hypothetical protein
MGTYWDVYLNVGRISSEVEMEKFVEITRKDKGFDKENSWYRVCEKQCIPFITIRARSKLADVQWDYMSYPPSIDEALFSQRERIKTQVSAIYDRYASKDTWFGAGPGVISFGNLEIGSAREAASELYDIIYEAARVALETHQTEQ